MTDIKRIPLSGSANTRDLGGFSTKDGQKILPNRLIRSCNLYTLTDEDKKTLTNTYHLRSIIDFRTKKEVAEKPDPVLPGVSYHNIPVIEDVTTGITREESDSNSFENTIGLLLKHGIDAGDYMQNVYTDIAKSSFSRNAYRGFFEVLLQQETGASLWHCSAGKDRAGMGTALLLYALGVDWDTIVQDYMMTGVFLSKELERAMAQASEKTDNPALLSSIRICMGVDEEYIESVFRTLAKECGSVDAFLTRHLGLTNEKQEQLKTRYLG